MLHSTSMHTRTVFQYVVSRIRQNHDEKKHSHAIPACMHAGTAFKWQAMHARAMTFSTRRFYASPLHLSDHDVLVKLDDDIPYIANFAALIAEARVAKGSRA